MRETALWQGTRRQWPAVSFIIHSTGHSDEVNQSPSPRTGRAKLEAAPEELPEVAQSKVIWTTFPRRQII